MFKANQHQYLVSNTSITSEEEYKVSYVFLLSFQKEKLLADAATNMAAKMAAMAVY